MKVTPAQRAAVEWGDGPLMVLASAGTGKTTVVVERIRHLLATDPTLEPENILVLTYRRWPPGRPTDVRSPIFLVSREGLVRGWTIGAMRPEMSLVASTD